MSENRNIIIKGARVNNLKNIDVEIPQGRFVVITGLSGSGKSSLAFDTLYAEGQRRYVESLSSYARQFLGRMVKPECDFIKNIPPAIAVEQKVNSRNSRSTVGTSTEIYEYMRLLFSRIGKTISPISGEEVKKHSIKDIVDTVLKYEEGTKYVILADIFNKSSRTKAEQLDMALKQGFVRIEVNGVATRIEEYQVNEEDKIYLIIDRLSVSDSKGSIDRLADSLQAALYEGDNNCLLRIYSGVEGGELLSFSNKFEADGMNFIEPTDQMFSFNSPLGACSTCEGYGNVLGIDEKLVVPNSSLSVYDGAVVCWNGEKMGEWREELIRVSEEIGFPIFTPYCDLTTEQKETLWNGNEKFAGINGFFSMLKEAEYKIQNRVMLSRYRGKTICPSCRGSRLKKDASYVKVGGKNISELVDMPIYQLKLFFDDLVLSDYEAEVSKRILIEIRNRISFLIDVGLGYLTLNRPSNTLSGGESQRINLATSLGSSLVGSMYILDEPSIGLHSKDTDKLIGVLKKLKDLGNTVVVVEHDEDIIRSADYIIDIGPDAGRLGGEIVYCGDMSNLQRGTKSHTVRYLLGEEQISVPTSRRAWNNYIEVKNVRANNLKGITVKFPLNLFMVVTGVSGSGKSSLVKDVLYRALKRHFDEVCDPPADFSGLFGNVDMLKGISLIDQNPIGKSSRSNPVTYIKAYDEIRKLWADQPLSKQMGYNAGYFSFNVEGGRCEECKGDGYTTVEMQFMADLVLECESCKGRRFKSDVLEVKYKGVNIYELLEMTVNQAIEFFKEHKQQKIVKMLQPLQSVGLGYIKLGQPSSTLSGGENQRVKLAYYLSMEKTQPTLFIFDEPTTGLHFHDIHKLLDAFDALIKRGHTVLVIEHNIDVAKCADYIIDLGVEGGDKGGELVVCGTPEEVAACERSYTGQYLKEKLHK